MPRWPRPMRRRWWATLAGTRPKAGTGPPAGVRSGPPGSTGAAPNLLTLVQDRTGFGFEIRAWPVSGPTPPRAGWTVSWEDTGAWRTVPILATATGTYRNGWMVSEPCALVHGDQLVLGAVDHAHAALPQHVDQLVLPEYDGAEHAVRSGRAERGVAARTAHVDVEDFLLTARALRHHAPAFAAGRVRS